MSETEESFEHDPKIRQRNRDVDEWIKNGRNPNEKRICPSCKKGFLTEEPGFLYSIDSCSSCGWGCAI